MLVDRTKIIDAIRRGMGSVAATPFSPGSPDFDSNIKPWPYDPKQANRLLDEAGWIDHNGDGVRDKNGVKFKFEMLASTSNSTARALMPIIEADFAKAGISVTGRQLELAVFQSTIRDQKADAAIGNWSTSLLLDPYQLFDSESARNRGSNYFNFRNAEADAAMEKAREEFDPQRRKELYWRFQEIFHEEQPCTLLFYASETAAYSVRLMNINFLHQRPGYEVAQWSINPGADVLAAK
jgi:peptide/nickel transport system substrate-binding protein